MKKLAIVLKQEFKMTAANKAFVVITIIGPFLILAISVLPGLLASRGPSVSPDTTVAVVGAPAEVNTLLQQALSGSNISVVTATSIEAAKERVLAEEIHGALQIPNDLLSAGSYNYFSRTGTDFAVSETLNGIIGQYVVRQRMENAGLDADEVSELMQQPRLVSNRLESGGESSESDFMSVFFVVLAFVMLIYMTVLFYGQIIGRSVLTEKTSKTVELMLSSVRPIDLLFGKVLGKGLAGLLQYAIWVTVALLLSEVVGPAASFTVPAALNAGNLGLLVVFFVLAFFLYASGYGALGAGAQDEQHLGQLGMVLIIFLVVPLVLISSFIMNPSSPLVVGLSYFPMTSPIVMLIRILLDPPAAWEVLLSIGLLLVTITAFVWMAAKIFRVGILMTGKRFSLGEILRWIRS